MALLISRMALAGSHQGGWIRYPATTTAASRRANANRREVQRWTAIVRSMATATFKHNSQRKGSCTKRSLGKCCQSRLLTESIKTTLAAPQAESSVHGLWSAIVPVALRATGQPVAAVPTWFLLFVLENQIAKARAPISASATDEIRRLKR